MRLPIWCGVSGWPASDSRLSTTDSIAPMPKWSAMAARYRSPAMSTARSATTACSTAVVARVVVRPGGVGRSASTRRRPRRWGRPRRSCPRAYRMNTRIPSEPWRERASGVLGDGRARGARRAEQVRRGEFDRETTLPGRDQHPVEQLGGLVDDARHDGPLPDRGDPAADVPRAALGVGEVRHRRPFGPHGAGERSEIEFPRDRDDPAGQRRAPAAGPPVSTRVSSVLKNRSGSTPRAATASSPNAVDRGSCA